MKKGYVNLDNYFVDGTKIEANANRSSFVWRKSVEKYKGKLRKKVNQLLEEIDEIEAAEEKQNREADLEEVGEGKAIDAEEMKEAMRKINKRLKQEPENQKVKKS